MELAEARLGDADNDTDLQASALLAVRGLTIRFGGVTALDDVSFEVPRGAICGLIGPNGAGKTTLFNCISRLYDPHAGSIAFDGRPLASCARHELASLGIARTFQNVALFKGMTSLDNIMTGRNLRMKRNLFWQALRRGPALDEEIANRRVCEEIIDFLEIEHIRKTPVGALPYGLQKRVELARALAMEPELLLLDEPMAGMNREEKEDMSRFIVEANRYRGATIALIEHDIGVVMDLSDLVVVLDYGRKIADDVPEKVKSDGKVIGAYLGVGY